jgi:histidine triad (HIT) family protein
MTLFQKIVARQIPAKIISEDDDLIVFHDINPQAPVHVLLVPKKVIPRLSEGAGNGRNVRNIADRISHRHQ